ncbi:MAG: aminoglycoside 6-adenylyltransferase [Treponema sp.]|jgi:aminoglycoside 6-adenylyltransferase|nr:aminoglycoside 6-adenylyltransferase [Treponema sp.]
MRSEQEMMDMILAFARHDERIRAVTMEGSRLNKNAPPDRFQDYDVSFIVRDIESYKKNDDWLDVFGKRIIMQKPEGMALFPPEFGSFYGYLMLYEDTNRIDLTLIPLEDIKKYFREADSLTKVILDKDNICPPLREPSDIDYRVQKPSPEFIDDCCNEFWWLSTYVTKGLCRNEPLYAIYHLQLMQKQLFNMTAWKVGGETHYAVSVGKSNKYLEKYVSRDIWNRILQTYQLNTVEALWEALKNCCSLFQEISAEVSRSLGYPYPDYAERVLKYIQQFYPAPASDHR